MTDYAFPQAEHVDAIGKSMGGLTKREHFAALFTQALLVSPLLENLNQKTITQRAIIMADALIEELESSSSC